MRAQDQATKAALIGYGEAMDRLRADPKFAI